MNLKSHPSHSGFFLASTVCFWTASALAQQSIPQERPTIRPASANRDADWEGGAELLKRIKVPPAPPLSPEDALKSFRVAPGYRVELVASEPMVQNPISFEFDPEGRLWVIEYQGYMRDVIGNGEGDPICRIVVLEDTDGDGKMDKRTVFLDKLVMPRSLSFVKGGVLVQEPPKVWFCEDTDGDLRCDKRTQVGTMGVAGNPQHTANGLRYGIDNWLHNSDWAKRNRWVNGKLEEEPTAYRGQFGASFDETGRYFSNSQNSALHEDLIPADYLVRNKNLAQVKAQTRGFTGINVNIATEAQEVFPIRVTPLITLGARELREDGRLRTYTIACGPCYYDGNQFPENANGNVFVPESGGNLVGRLKLTSGVQPKATRFYPAEQEFLASTDERFRPVNARVGPDGALYLADMYHGIIEHAIFMVPWISNQVRDRHLDTGNDMGRIYRVVSEDRPLDRTRPHLSKAGTADLVSHLSDGTGWWRLTSQRLLVEQNQPEAAPLLKDLALHGKNPLGRLHALWTLDGLAALDAETKFAAINDSDERVRAAAIRLSEHGLTAEQQTTLLAKLGQAADDKSDAIRLQVALTASSLPQPEVLPLLAKLGTNEPSGLYQTAIMTGIQGRELDFLRVLLGDPKTARQANLVTLATQCVMAEGRAGKPERIAALLETLSQADEPTHAQSHVLMDAILSLATKGSGAIKQIPLAKEPAILTELTRSNDGTLRQKAFRLMDLFTWPGATPLASSGVDLAALTPEQQKRIEVGQAAYSMLCGPCHQPTGSGAPNLAPPLAGSDWVAGPAERITRIVLNGLYGPVQVNDQTWNLAMPGLGASGLLDDEKLASILSYVRRAWDNTASLVEPALVAKVRSEIKDRVLPWTATELEAIAGTKSASTAPIAPPLKPAASGEILLPASKATVFAQKLAYRSALDVLAPWTQAEDIVEWQVEVSVSGTYEVAITLASNRNSKGSFCLETEGSRAKGAVLDTGGFEQFQEQNCGQITLRAGINRILLHPDAPIAAQLADVRLVRLTPVSPVAR